ncbi:hypothetical protein AGMMS50229_13200 [Campylobacterota bacterium]|nr:hypothetical protein AGMMS50229_13200 [Campylobacterota bacterium]
MKIEIGESLIYSWLRHIRHCQIVQTNWKASKRWGLQEQSVLEKVMLSTEKHFRSEYDYHIYKGNKNLSQLLQQAELDVVGVNLDAVGTHYFAIDVAFHESGLNYGSRKETVERVIKKILRSAMCLYGYFGSRSGELVFASPKISPTLLADLEKPLEDVNNILRENGFEFTAGIIANQDFDKQIMSSVLSIASDVADTTELFLRSLQLTKMFENAAKPPVLPTDGSKPVHSDTPAVQPHKEYVLHGAPCSSAQMHNALVNATRANRTLYYADGRADKTMVWDTANYSVSSSLSSNLNSGPLRDWEKKGIVRIKIEVE